MSEGGGIVTDSDEEINDPNYPMVICDSANKDVTSEGYPCVKFIFLVKLLKSMKAKRILLICYEQGHINRIKANLAESKFRVGIAQSRYYLYPISVSASNVKSPAEIGVNVVETGFDGKIGYWVLQYDDYIDAINEWSHGKLKDEFHLDHWVYARMSYGIKDITKYPRLATD